MTEKEVAVSGREELGTGSLVAFSALEALREGLASRQVSGEMRRPSGRAPELHASIPGTCRPVVVTVAGERFRWWRVDGEQVSCPVVCLTRAVDMVIHAVSIS